LIEVELYNTADAPKVAKAFILYREKRKQEREKNERFANIIRQRALTPDAANEKANANLDECSYSGMMNEANEALWKEIALSDFMPQDIADLHKNYEVYLHDLSRWAIGQTNCLTFSFDKIFKDGFIVRNSGLRPPGRFSSACQQVAVIMQCFSLA